MFQPSLRVKILQTVARLGCYTSRNSSRPVFFGHHACRVSCFRVLHSCPGRNRSPSIKCSASFGDISPTRRKLADFVIMEAKTDVEKTSSDSVDVLDGLTSTSYPIRTSGPPSVFSSLHFEEVPTVSSKVPQVIPKKRRFSLTEEGNTCNIQREENEPANKRRSILDQDLLEQVSDFVRHNADKVPLPNSDALLDSFEPDKQHKCLDCDLGHLAGLLGDELLTDEDTDGDDDLPKLPVPSPSDDCPQYQHDDVYDLSPLFLNNWPDYELKSRKKKISAEKSDSDTKFQHGEQDEQGAGTKRKQPNYFVAIQVKNPQIHRELSLVQDHIREQEPLLSAAMIPIATLHLTLMVLYLDREDIPRARLALMACGNRLKDLTSQPLILTVSGIGNFRNEVVFAKVEEESSRERLQEVANCVSRCFAEYDLVSTDKKNFQAHLTILKLSRAPKLRHKGLRKIDPTLYQELTETTFGRQTVTGLQLCAMCLPKDERGYYHVEEEIEFVPDTYEEPDLIFSDQSVSPESTVSRKVVKEAVASAIHKLREEALKNSREKKCSAKSAAKAKRALKGALKDLKMEHQAEASKCEPDGDERKPKVFIAELEKELAWKFEVGEDPSKEYILNRLKKLPPKKV